MFKLVNILITQLVSKASYHINDLIKSHGKYVCILKMKQQQHDINLRRTRKKKMFGSDYLYF